MKAFKQINLSKERKLVISYASALSIIGCMILLSPVLAQEQDTTDLVPRTHMEVHKNYDEQGNLQEYDSTWSQTWQYGSSHINALDSIFAQFDLNGMGFNPWLINPNDSSFLDPFGMNEDFFGNLNIPPELFNFEYNDSLQNTLPNKQQRFGSMPNDSISMKAFEDQHAQMLQRLEQFREEHRKLLEQYFGGSSQSMDDMQLFEQSQPLEPYKSKSESVGKI